MGSREPHRNLEIGPFDPLNGEEGAVRPSITVGAAADRTTICADFCLCSTSLCEKGVFSVSWGFKRSSD